MNQLYTLINIQTKLILRQCGVEPFHVPFGEHSNAPESVEKNPSLHMTAKYPPTSKLL